MTLSYRGVSDLFHVSEAGYADRYAKSSYPYEVKYSGNDSGGPRRRVRFNISTRHDMASGVRTCDTHRLDSIEMRLGLGAETLARKYSFEYDTSDANQLRLFRVREIGSDNVSALPYLEFTYENKEMRYHAGRYWETHFQTKC